MAEAAMIEEEAIPEGGIAGFVMSDEDLSALAEQEAVNEFGGKGIAEFRDVSAKMAGLGRGGDQFIAHLAPGELVVPAPLIENNPELRDTIFENLRNMGVEDPEQYLVGAAANSINPETGLMEFGFFSKIVKGVKKAVKSVGKVLKKVAPVVLPAVLAATPLGPVFGPALGSGISTLINGGSIGDAAKSALFAGGIGAVGAGLFGQGKFGENVQAAISSPGQRFSQTLSSAGKAFTGQGDFFGQQGLFADPRSRIGAPSTATAAELQAVTQPALDMTTAAQPPKAVGAQGTPPVADLTGGTVAPTAALPELNLQPEAPVVEYTGNDPTGTFIAGATGGPPPPEPGFFSQAMETIMPSDVTAEQVLRQEGIDPLKASAAEYRYATAKAAELSPSFLDRYGPIAALGAAGLYAGGFFDAPEEEEQVDIAALQGPTGADLIARDPEKYRLSQAAVTPVRVPYGQTIPQYVVPTRFPMTQTLAEGGEVYPRRNGGIMPDEGIPGQDSVRALLMPGEFVMTTDAVRGAGGGDLSRGIKNMYGVMRNLERRGKAAV